MHGFCEACGHDSPASADEYGVQCCTDCGNDITVAIHEEPTIYEEDDDEEYFPTTGCQCGDC